METVRKIAKKALILLAVFVAATAVYFVLPLNESGDSGTVTYTAMEEAAFPVIYPEMYGRQMAPLFGHTEEMAVTAGRDSLIVLPESRKLPITVDEAWEVSALRYEIRSGDMEHLVERTELTDWKKRDGRISASLPIQNLLEKEEEYELGINLILSDGKSLWYYTRILETENEHLGEMLDLAAEFSAKSFDYSAAQDMTMYMESSAGADNSSFGNVTLKNSFTQITWGNLGVRRDGPVFTTLKELSDNLSNVQIEYDVVRDEEGTEERYQVRENFTMRWATQRIYMMDYEREMNQLFTGSSGLVSGKRITLGIESGRDLYAKKSPGGKTVAFVTNRELWAYDGRLIRVFAFGGAGTTDLRANNPRHGIEILEVDENGGIDFLVYGYMNRGAHEGTTGVSIYRYQAEENTLEERFFIPVSEPYEQLKLDVERLAHKSGNGILYLFLDRSVYGIDLTSGEYVVVASGLTDNKFAVSGDGSRFAWQESSGVYSSGTLSIMDLDTGERTQLGTDDPEMYRILGFVGNDCVYGVGDAGDFIMSNNRNMGLYLKKLNIVDKGMNSVMSYEKEGRYIRDVQVDESRIHIRTVRNRNHGFFENAANDTVVCNAEALPGRMDDIGWYVSEVKGRIYFVQLEADAGTSPRPERISPEELTADDLQTISVESGQEPSTMEFYAYGRGRYLGRYVRFADAVTAAYDSMGFVAAGPSEVIWVRGNKANTYNIRDLSTALRRFDRNLETFERNRWAEDESLMLELSGCSLSEVLYFVGKGMPVLAYTGEGQYLYLTGYDRNSVRVYDPAADSTETWEQDSAQEYFERAGSDYICCVFTK